MTNNTTMSTLKFVIDRKYDTQMVYHMVKSGIYKNEKDASEKLGLGLELVKKLSKADRFQQIENELAKVADGKYKYTEKYLRSTIIQYQKSWDEIDTKFFNRLEKLSGSKIKYKKYYCVVSLFHDGVSNWNGNIIIRHWNRNAYTQRRITAHEIIIAHFFSVARSKFGKIDENKIWKLAEVYAFALTGLDKEMTSFWPWDKTGNYTNHNYPELISLQNSVGPKMLKKSIEQIVKDI